MGQELIDSHSNEGLAGYLGILTLLSHFIILYHSYIIFSVLLRVFVGCDSNFGVRSSRHGVDLVRISKN
jgi:hypothetical protein